MFRRSFIGLGLLTGSCYLMGCAAQEEDKAAIGKCVLAGEVEPSSSSGTAGGFGDVRLSQDHYLSDVGLALSPDGALLAANETWHRKALGLSQKYGATIWDVASGSVMRRFGDERIGALAWHPSGELLALGGDATIGLTSLDGKPVWQLQAAPTKRTPGVTDVAFSPDGTHLASVHRDEGVRIWRTKDAGCLPLHLIKSEDPRSVSFSADGTLLAVAGGQGCSLWDVHQGKQVKQIEDLPELVNGVARRGESWVVITSEPGRICLIDEAGKVIAESEPSSSNPRYLAVNAQGQVVVSAAGDALVVTWDPAKDSRAELQTAPSAVGRVAWAPDGQAVYGVTVRSGVVCWASGTLSEFELPIEG